MKRHYPLHDDDPGDWREKAIRFLLKQTYALRDAIEHFVDHHWLTDASEEENLDSFEVYQGEYSNVFNY